MTAILAASAAALASCSTVFEDRSECNCILRLDVGSVLGVSAPAEMAGCPLTALAYDGVTQHRLARADTVLTDTTECVELLVPRSRTVTVTVILTGRGSKGEVMNDVLTLPSGEQGDSLYAFHREGIETGHRTDELTLPVAMHKQFTTLTVNGVTGRPSEELLLQASGGTSALDLRTLAPAEGALLCAAAPDTASARGRWTLRLPRQGGDSLYMDVSDATPGGGSVTLIDLAAALAGAGYDFAAEDLADASLDLDLRAGTAAAGYGEWGDTVSIEKKM